jgi:hypothetical protein
MTLENYGVEPPAANRTLQDWTAENFSEQGTHVMAWACMSLDPARRWPTISAFSTKNREGAAQ